MEESKKSLYAEYFCLLTIKTFHERLDKPVVDPSNPLESLSRVAKQWTQANINARQIADDLQFSDTPVPARPLLVVAGQMYSPTIERLCATISQAALAKSGAVFILAKKHLDQIRQHLQRSIELNVHRSLKKYTKPNPFDEVDRHIDNEILELRRLAAESGFNSETYPSTLAGDALEMALQRWNPTEQKAFKALRAEFQSAKEIGPLIGQKPNTITKWLGEMKRAGFPIESGRDGYRRTDLNAPSNVTRTSQ